MSSIEKLLSRVDVLLDGIDRSEDDPLGGWWQSSDGARVGRIKLRELKDLIREKTKTEADAISIAKLALVASAKINCLREWDATNDPPCHPSDDGWEGCGLCVKSAGLAAAFRIIADHVDLKSKQMILNAADYLDGKIQTQKETANANA